jgi:ketosteroid isomerase-like protein
MEVRPFWEDEDAEGQIRRLDAELTEAVRTGDTERRIACYAQDAEVVTEGRHHKGAEALRKALAETPSGPAIREVLDFRVHVDESIAFGHALVRSDGTLLRVTTGYRDIGPRWLIVHEHVTEATS